MSYGHFNEDYTEYIVTRPDTSHVMDNFLWNNKVFSHVTQNGLGYFFYDHQGTEITEITYGRVEENGYDKCYNRLIFIRDNETGEYWNLNWEPVLNDLDDFQCVQGLGYTRISSMKNDIRATLMIFIPPGDDAVETWQLTIENLADRKRNLSVFTYNEITLHSVFTYGDIIYLYSDYHEDTNAVVTYKRAEAHPHENFTAFFTSDVKAVGYDCDRDVFKGGYYAMINKPKAVEQGHCFGSKASRDWPCTVLQIPMMFDGKGEQKANFLLGLTSSADKVQGFRTKYFDNDGIDKAFQELQSVNAERMSKNVITCPDKELEALVNIWNKQQVAFGAYFTRWGYRGYRDIIQQNMAQSLFDPAKARPILLHALKYQYSSGRAVRGWCPMDERPYTDNALWMVMAVSKYLQESGDLALLDEVMPYYDEGEATMYEHMLQAADFSWENRGEHGLPLIKFGDWNDSLTQIGKEGKGESVWLAMAAARVTLELARIAELRGETDRVAELKARHKAFADAVNDHCWDGDWYVRAIDDTGRYLGTKSNKEGRMYLNAQSWAILGQVAREDRIEKMIAACDDYLDTPVGYRLLRPTYTDYDPNIGRITNMRPGIAENGTIYSHANAFMMLALLDLGLADKAYDLFCRQAPIKEVLPQEQTGSVPYTFANCYFGPDHQTKPLLSEYSWITGSVTWYYRNVIEDMFGARSDYQGLVIAPCLPSAWNECGIRRHFRGKVFNVAYKRDTSVDAVRITLNGTPLDGNLIDPAACPDTNTVDVQLPLT